MKDKIIIEKINNLLKQWNTKFLSLVNNSSLNKIWKHITSALDLPLEFSNKDFYGDFNKYFKLSWYKWINVGITSLWWNKKIIKKIIDSWHKIISFHGTSIKKTINNWILYREVLKRDLEVINDFWLKKTHINYDLYAGHSSDLTFSRTYKKTFINNINNICSKLNIQWKNKLQLLIKYLITEIDEVYKNTNHIIYLEIPWSKWWSMLPEITNDNIEYIVSLINKSNSNIKLCIDLWHVLTWSRNTKKIEEYMKILEKYWSYIWMVHISSAWSWRKDFIDLYKIYYNNKYPLWHIKSLDLQLEVSEWIMLDLIKQIRKISNNIIEVSETRLPSRGILDYFSLNNVNFIDDSIYFKNIISQWKLLWYKK